MIDPARVQQLTTWLKTNLGNSPEALKMSAQTAGYTEEEFKAALANLNPLTADPHNSSLWVDVQLDKRLTNSPKPRKLKEGGMSRFARVISFNWAKTPGRQQVILLVVSLLLFGVAVIITLTFLIQKNPATNQDTPTFGPGFST